MTPADLTYLKKALPQRDADRGAYRLPGRVIALAAGYVTKAIDRGRMTVQSVLTYPGPDYDDDTVRPDGGDWAGEFPRNPVVNWTHREPIGRGSVPELKSVGGELLPVGTTHFFQSAADLKGLRLVSRDERGDPTVPHTPKECLDAAASAFRLVADDVAPGVSLEFRGTDYWPVGKKSLTLGRDAIHWEKWVGLGWAHALRVKNPNAMTILPADEARLEKAFRIAETGRFPGGQLVSPVVMKAFEPLKGRRPQYHRVERKAMDNPTPAPDGVPDIDPATGDLKEGGGGDMKPTPTLIMTALQHFKDGVALIREGVEGNAVEHEGGIDILTDYADKFDALLDKLNTEAAKEFPDAGFQAAGKATDPAADEVPVETNDDGAITNKAFPAGFPVRFRVARDGSGFERVPPPAAGPDPVRMKALEAELDELRLAARRERKAAERDARTKARNDERARAGY